MNYLTEDLPGIGGIYKQCPEDFQVEEIPLYPCSGEGEHTYLWIEKSGISTRDLLTQLARKLKLKERDIGYAGLKDAQALTRQMVSIPANKFDPTQELHLSGAKVLSSSRHNNKLRIGHLAGNCFTITIRETIAEALPQASAIINQLEKRGVPNLFGEQRYGILGNSAQLGLLLLQQNYSDFCHEFIGDPALIRNQEWKAGASLYREGKTEAAMLALPKRMRDERRLLRQLLEGKSHQVAVLALPRSLLRLFLSAIQSQLFDQLLKDRLPHLDKLIVGDIAVKHINGACFRIEDTKSEQHRADSLEISPSAPLFGTKAMLADGTPGQAERDLLKTTGLNDTNWSPAPKLTMPGARRPLRFPLTDATIPVHGNNFITISFILPKGCYATSVLRELIKN